MSRCFATKGYVEIEFVGGPRDGELLAGDVDSPESLGLAGVYRQLRGGKVGELVWVPTEYAMASLRSLFGSQAEVVEQMGLRFPGHAYQVFARRVSRQRVLVRLSHCGACE